MEEYKKMKIINKIKEKILNILNPQRKRQQAQQEMNKTLEEVLCNAEIQKPSEVLPNKQKNICTSTCEEISTHFTPDNKQLPIIIQTDNKTYYPIQEHYIKRVPGKCRRLTGGQPESLILRIDIPRPKPKLDIPIPEEAKA